MPDQVVDLLALLAEEVERLITVPIETEMNGLPGLSVVRSISLYGLSDVRLTFTPGTDSYFARLPERDRATLRRILTRCRVEGWRASLGRCSCSLLSRPFVCECHSISTMPRFQPPPRRTQRADFPHCALLFASPQGLWDLSCRGDFRP